MTPTYRDTCLPAVLALVALSVHGHSMADLQAGVPTLAAPVDFRAVLIDESTVEMSWNDTLLDGSDPAYFIVREGASTLATITDNRWRFEGIDRDRSYDFSVSAVLPGGEESRRSSRIYFDLPQLQADQPDGWNAQLPPLENLEVEILDASSVRLRWDPPAAFWSWVDPSEYEFTIYVRQSGVANTADTSYVLEGLDPAEPVWVSVSVHARCCDQYSRMGNLVYVDTALPAGTVIPGYPGFSAVDTLRTAVYSGTAAEIFWRHNQFPTTTHVYLDGRLLAREPDVLSVFLDDLEPGRSILVSIGEGWTYEWGDNGHDSLLIHGWIQMQGEPVDDSGRPLTMSSLRAEVYSPTAAELFWDRLDVVPVRYRVEIEGAEPIETSGVSLFLDGLADGTTYLAEVRALGANDAESRPETVHFMTPSAWRAATPGCAVDGLRAEMYSDTAVEIFWDRDPAGLTYALELDGNPAGITRGVSWFLDGLASGVAHRARIEIADEVCAGAGDSVEFLLGGKR